MIGFIASMPLFDHGIQFLLSFHMLEFVFSLPFLIMKTIFFLSTTYMLEFGNLIPNYIMDFKILMLVDLYCFSIVNVTALRLKHYSE